MILCVVAYVMPSSCVEDDVARYGSQGAPQFDATKDAEALPTLLPMFVIVPCTSISLTGSRAPVSVVSDECSNPAWCALLLLLANIERAFYTVYY